MANKIYGTKLGYLKRAKLQFAYPFATKILTPFSLPLEQNSNLTKAPFFIFGTGRNGSTLLSCILNNHPQFFIPAEQYAMPYSILNWKFSKLSNWSTFVNKNVDKLANTAVEWKVDFNALKTGLNKLEKGNRNLTSYWDFILRQYGNQYGKTDFYWGDKTPLNSNYAPWIIKQFSDCKIVFLMRDPRAVINSLQEADYHVELDYMIWTWNFRFEKYQWLKKHYSDGMMLVKYEDFVANPEVTVGKICKFLNVDFKDNLLDNYAQHLPLLGGQNRKEHQNVNRAIDASNAHRWKSEMDSKVAEYIFKKTKHNLREIYGT